MDEFNKHIDVMKKEMEKFTEIADRVKINQPKLPELPNFTKMFEGSGFNKLNKQIEDQNEFLRKLNEQMRKK